MMSRPQFFAHARNGSYAGCSTEQLYFAYEVYLTCPMSRVPEPATFPSACSRCGNCCRHPWRIEVSLNDIQRWIGEGRTDILETLELRPRHSPMTCGWGDSTEALHTTIKAVQCGEAAVDMALAIAYASVSGGDSYVLPKAGGCKYLIEGENAMCGIYNTRPDVCRHFPEL